MTRLRVVFLSLEVRLRTARRPRCLPPRRAAIPTDSARDCVNPNDGHDARQVQLRTKRAAAVSIGADLFPRRHAAKPELARSEASAARSCKRDRNDRTTRNTDLANNGSGDNPLRAATATEC